MINTIEPPDDQIIVNLQIDLKGLQLVYDSIELNLKKWEDYPHTSTKEQIELTGLRNFFYKTLMNEKYKAGII